MISVEGVARDFGSVRVGPISFEVLPGTITGLLGPNGSGKTTTLRRMLELTRGPGTTRFGGLVYSERRNPQKAIGAMFDGSPAHPGRSVANHILLAATTAGVDREKCAQTLERVGLASDAGQKVGRISFGMRQRLGIAAALIGSPRFLVLDEPGNGLDPAGVVWFRTLLRELADSGCAIVLSSHDLSTVDGVADRIVVINEGIQVTDSSLREFLDHSGLRTVEVSCGDTLRAIDALTAGGLQGRLEKADDVIRISGSTLEQVGRLLVDAEVTLSRIAYGTRRLEDAFFAATDGESD